VVGTDFSYGSLYALERALGAAQDSRAHVVLVHAYEDEPGASALADPTSNSLIPTAEASLFRCQVTTALPACGRRRSFRQRFPSRRPRPSPTAASAGPKGSK